MPNISIDGGYYSYLVTHLSRNTGEPGYEPDLPTMDAYMIDQRDRWKFVLENQNNGLDWEVGRVFRWEGATDYYAYGFVVRVLDGAGAATDNEFLMVYGGPDIGTGARRAAPEDVFSASVGNYFQISGGVASEGFIGYHYNYGALSDTYDVGSGADIDPPGTNPHTNPAGFFPDPVIQGVPFLQGNIRSDYNRVTSGDILDWRHCWVVNGDVPFIAFYSNYRISAQVRIGAVLGDILVNEDPSDPRTEAGMHYTTRMGREWDGGDQSLGAWAISQRFGDSRAFNTFIRHNKFTVLNQPRVNGTYDRDRVKIVNTNEHKGYIKEDIIAITGTAADWPEPGGDHKATFDCAHGLLLKVMPEMATPWVVGQSPPFAGWPKYPQDFNRTQ